MATPARMPGTMAAVILTLVLGMKMYKPMNTHDMMTKGITFNPICNMGASSI